MKKFPLHHMVEEKAPRAIQVWPPHFPIVAHYKMSASQIRKDDGYKDITIFTAYFSLRTFIIRGKITLVLASFMST